MCIYIIDLGSQYTHLISKRLRLLGYKSEIIDQDFQGHNLKNPKGLIISGGPGTDLTGLTDKIFATQLPILGICLGHQLISAHYGGAVEKKAQTEFGKSNLSQVKDSLIWEGVRQGSQIWMSHFDSVTNIPTDFDVIGQTNNGVVAALQHTEKPIYTLQFHPEVSDTQDGYHILLNFAKICKARRNWSMDNFSLDTIETIKTQVGDRKVLLFVSGGIDSTVAFELLNASIGQDRVLGLFVDNGFMRKNESAQIRARYDSLGYTNIKYRDYSADFLSAIQGLIDPEQKRKSVGETFLKVREKFISELELDPDEWMLGQGTLYPDIIESGGTRNSKVIKSHHNRVAGVQEFISKGLVIEPLKDLYKDEARILGDKLGLPKDIVYRHPFPGPGLSINVLCADHKIKKKYKTRLPVDSVGVQGDMRTYTQPVVIELEKDWQSLESKSIEITNQLADANRVVTYLPPPNQHSFPTWQSRTAYCTKERLDLLREADYVITQSLEKHRWMKKIFQHLTILLPVSVNGDKDSVVIRPVCSRDVMTAKFAKIDWPIVDEIVNQLYNIREVDSVFYDITHKPPGTFGWE